MPNLYGEAAGLFKGAADTTVQTADLAEKRREANSSLLQRGTEDVMDVAKTKMGEDAAMDRQKMAGAQDIQKLLAASQLKAQQDRDQYLLDHTFVVDDKFAQGISRATGMDFSAMVGQRMEPKDAIAPAIGIIKAKFHAPKITTIDTPNGPMQVNVAMSEDENGNWVPNVTPVGKTFVKPNAGRGSAGGKSKDAAHWFGEAQKAQKSIQDYMTKKGGGIPQDGLIDLIREGKVTGQTKATQYKIGTLRKTVDLYNASVRNYNLYADKEGLEKFTPDAQVDAAVNQILTLSGGEGGTGAKEDKVGDYLKSVHAKDTPANRQWAQGKLGG